ncbi:hypothetical protein CYMTET_8746 [Cymbomonas tetramitiformis]|uniref:Uncharacterized protein n=1 Tax=Cymbomonas tetramitiformis TaxID=36881 RepID=A0AAE0GSU3_9CHLO|nr:hypothetical protein CYMTET_8746 [Cymbomonas tetramitiformis]
MPAVLLRDSTLAGSCGYYEVCIDKVTNPTRQAYARRPLVPVGSLWFHRCAATPYGVKLSWFHKEKKDLSGEEWVLRTRGGGLASDAYVNRITGLRIKVYGNPPFGRWEPSIWESSIGCMGTLPTVE